MKTEELLPALETEKRLVDVTVQQTLLSFTKEESATQKNIASPVIHAPAPYYDELHFANYE